MNREKTYKINLLTGEFFAVRAPMFSLNPRHLTVSGVFLFQKDLAIRSNDLKVGLNYR